MNERNWNWFLNSHLAFLFVYNNYDFYTTFVDLKIIILIQIAQCQKEMYRNIVLNKNYNDILSQLWIHIWEMYYYNGVEARDRKFVQIISIKHEIFFSYIYFSNKHPRKQNYNAYMCNFTFLSIITKIFKVFLSFSHFNYILRQKHLFLNREKVGNVRKIIKKKNVFMSITYRQCTLRI